MFNNLAHHKKILVTGPHRSGTTFAATVIHEELKHTHGLVKEELCRFCQRDAEYWLTNDVPVIVQAPFMADICHQYPHVFVVFMMRDIEDIVKSQGRMFLDGGDPVQWRRLEAMEKFKTHTRSERPIAAIKYENWQYQKERLPNHLELHYESLSDHPLWVDKPFRKGFHVRQTSAVA